MPLSTSETQDQTDERSGLLPALCSVSKQAALNSTGHQGGGGVERLIVEFLSEAYH